MKTTPYLLHALSPLHAGTGSAADVIELPIARMKATGIPFVPGPSIKGVLRDARGSSEETEAVFGPSDDPGAFAGALVVGDARLLALPVRSFRGTFAWVTSPLLLSLAKRDIDGVTDNQLPVPNVSDLDAIVVPGSCSVHGGRLYLEELDLPVTESSAAEAWAIALAPIVSPGADIFSKRFAVVGDEAMTFLWETATQVDARVRIDEKKRTAAKGALWLEESLPPETVLVGLLAADRSRHPNVDMKPCAVLDYALKAEETLQFGGKATTGRGRCRMVRMYGVARKEQGDAGT